MTHVDCAEPRRCPRAARRHLCGLTLLPLFTLLMVMSLSPRTTPSDGTPEEQGRDLGMRDVRFVPWWRTQLHQAYGSVLRERALLDACRAPAQPLPRRLALVRTLNDYNRLARQAPTEALDGFPHTLAETDVLPTAQALPRLIPVFLRHETTWRP